MITVVMAGDTGSSVVREADPQLVLWGFSAAETAVSGAAAEAVIRHGTSANGSMIFAPINFAAEGFAYPTFLPNPVQCPNGIYLERRSGNTTFILYVDYQ